MNRLVALCVLGAATSAVHSFAANSQATFLLAIGLLLLAAEIYLINRMGGGFNAAHIPILAVTGILLVAMFFWDGIRHEAIVSVRFAVSEEDHQRATVIGIIFSAAFTGGALLARPRALTFSATGALVKIKIPDGLMVLIGYLGIALTILSRQDQLLAGKYLAAPGPEWATGISNAAAPLSVLALCIVAARPGKWRQVAAVGVALWTLILFARSSRTLAAIPGLIVLTRAIVGGKRVGLLSIATAVAATTLFLQLPLVGRANSGGVGIFPLTEQLFTRPDEVFGQFSLGALLGNIIFSGPLTAVVAGRDIDMHAFWVSINPAIGSMTDWPNIKAGLRIIPSTPYNAIGELAAQGWLVLVISAAAMGFSIAALSSAAARLPGTHGIAAQLIVLGVTAFFSVSILQYNLRSSVRLIWYMLAVVGVLYVLSLVRSDRKTGPQEAGAGGQSRMSVRAPGQERRPSR